MKIPIEVSARHVHLSQSVFRSLFGDNYNLTPKRFLSQPGQFLCEEKVEVIGNKGSIKNVSVLGPFRDKTQVEMSITDLKKLGIGICIRESGDLLKSEGCRIVGPNGEFVVRDGVIAAKRHIHMSPKHSAYYGVNDKQIVKLGINSENRSLVFGDMVVRVSSDYCLACHIDTDESNAAGIVNEAFGEIIG